MQLTIINNDNLDLDEFCNWLVSRMREQMRESLPLEKLSVRDEKINKAVTLTMPQTLTAVVVIKIAINNIKWSKPIGSTYKIAIDEKPKLYGTKNTVYELAKYLEFGGIGIEPLNFFRPIFNEYGKDIQKYYNKYLELKGV